MYYCILSMNMGGSVGRCVAKVRGMGGLVGRWVARLVGIAPACISLPSLCAQKIGTVLFCTFCKTFVYTLHSMIFKRNSDMGRISVRAACKLPQTDENVSHVCSFQNGIAKRNFLRG
jgi:hypothetical protein